MIAKLVKVNGKTKIQINDQIVEPLSFKSFRPTPKNVSDFAKAGVKVYSIFTTGMKSRLKAPYSLYGESWLDDETYDFNPIDKQIDMFIENAPDCYFAIMIQLDTRDWWLEKYKNYSNSFFNLSQVCNDEKWRELSSKYMKAVMEHVEEKYGEKIYGYFLMCGTTTEWFSDYDNEKPHEIKEKAYKKYCNDQNATIPLEVDRPMEQFFLNPNDAKDVELMRYRRFSHQSRAETILYFAREAQSIIKHQKLLGVYFGYVFELAPTRLWNTGHIEYEKVFLSPDIDMISSPSSYAFRGQDSTSGFMITYDTLAEHDKLYYLEFDHITHLAPEKVEGLVIPGYANKCKNEKETFNLMRRDFMLNITKGTAMWWFDMFEGWFYSDGMMAEIKNMIEITKKYGSLTAEKAEVAYIVDPDSLYYVNKTNPYTAGVLDNQRFGMALSGVAYDVFSSCDLSYERLKQYKMVVFMTQYKTTIEQRREINKLKSDGRLIVWCYGANYIGKDDGVVDIEVHEVGYQPYSRYNDYSRAAMQTPVFGVEDKDATPIVEYYATKGLGVKDLGNYKVAYSALNGLSGDLLRRLAKIAGVHLYSNTSDIAVYPGGDVFGIYHRFGDDAIINLKEDGEYKELWTGKVYSSRDKMLLVPYDNEKAKLFIKL